MTGLKDCICQAYPIPNPLFHNRKCPYYLVYEGERERKDGEPKPQCTDKLEQSQGKL